MCVKETTYQNSKVSFKNGCNFSSDHEKKSCRIFVGVTQFSKLFSFDFISVF